jgi:hypothetical protein
MQTTTSVLLGLLPAFVWCYCAGGEQHSADQPTRLEDPVFGLSYSYTEVHYEQTPTWIRRVCSDLGRGTYWTFARTKRDSGDYYVVMGVFPEQMGDSLGAALRIRGSSCYGWDSTQMFSGFVPVEGYDSSSVSNKVPAELPGFGAPQICGSVALGPCHYMLRSAEEEAILRGLAVDALSRGVRAWGGEDRFRKAACGPLIRQGNSTTPIIQQELSRFCAGKRGHP